MSFRAVFMEDADRDLAAVEDYLVQFYANTARKFFDNLKKKVLSLEDNPYLYPVYKENPYFRKMVFGDYLLFYAVEENRNLVVIHRIFHGSRDVSQQILESRQYPQEF